MMQGKTRADRHNITSAASKAIDESGGWLLDFKQFSNIAISLTMELPPSGFTKLRKKLAELEVIMQPTTTEEIAAIGTLSTEEIPSSLHITFIHEEPDLHIPVPAVPG